MNAHTPFDANQDWTNPYCRNSSNDPMVDALLGNAYHVVRTVYCNLGYIKHLYDFLSKYGVVICVQSVAELKTLTTEAKYARIYDKSPAGDRRVTDYLYVDDDRTGILPDDTTATGSWINVATSNSGDGSKDGGYIPWVYNSGSANGGETSIRIPDETAGAPFMIVNGDWQTEGYDFEYDPLTFEIKFTTPLEQGDFVVVMRTGIPATPDNPNVSDWVTINWLYNHGAAVGGEQVIDIPYTFQSVPAVYKNGLRFSKGLANNSYTIDPDNNRIILTEPLATNDRLVIQLGGEAKVLETVDHTIQEVARVANVKDSEVILSTDTTQSLNGKKVVYSVSEQKAYGLPALPSNIYINSVSNGQLTYSPGNITVDLVPVPNSGIDVMNALRADLASNGGAGLVGPGVMTRGNDKFSIMQGRSGEHRQDTLTRGLSVELNETISGIGFAGATNTYMFNRLYIKDDKVDAVNDGTPGSKVDGLVVQHHFGGAGTRGGRHAAEFMLTQRGVTESDNTDRNYVGVVGYCATNTGDGGTSDTDKKGGYFGGNFFTTIKNAPFVGHANGCESNVLIDANSSVYYRAGYSAVSGGEKQATRYDAAYSVGALGLSGAKWKDGILMGVQNGRNPVSRSMVRGEGLSVPKIISFSGGIPADIITSDNDPTFNFRVDRLEMYYSNASVRLGAKTASNTPYIEAYTDASGNRAGRIIFNGTAVSEGNGVCNIQFRQTTVRELVPSTASRYNCGTSTLPWAGGFTQTAFTVTSDEKFKTAPLEITDAILDAAEEVQLVQYKYLDRIEEKGEDGARWHFGAIAQRYVEAFAKHGLDAHHFGFICYDEWDDTPAVVDDETGEVVAPAIKAGSRYGIRYEEMLVLEAAVQRRKVARLESRIESLETLLSEIATK